MYTKKVKHPVSNINFSWMCLLRVLCTMCKNARYWERTIIYNNTFFKNPPISYTNSFDNKIVTSCNKKSACPRFNDNPQLN